MLLTGDKILKEVLNGKIRITPFNTDLLGPNSYDVHLGSELRVYINQTLDMRKENLTCNLPSWWDEAAKCHYWVLQPGELYLGRTVEKIRSDYYVPWINGRSSVGRLGMFIHVTAGQGDLGFDGTYTLEIVVTKFLKVYPGERVGQVSFLDVLGERTKLYQGKYQGQVGVTPSKMWQDHKQGS